MRHSRIKSLTNFDWNGFFRRGIVQVGITILAVMLIFIPMIYLAVQKGNADQAQEKASSEEVRGFVFNIVQATSLPTNGVTPVLVLVHFDNKPPETFYVEDEEVILELQAQRRYLLTVYTPQGPNNPRRRISKASLIVET